MHLRYATAPSEVMGMNTAQLRERFLAQGLTAGGSVELLYAQDDRIVIGGVRPGPGERVPLPNPPQLRGDSFLERRELGIVNLAGPGTVEVDGITFELGRKECLYVGRGAERVLFHGPAAEVGVAGEAAGREGETGPVYYLVSTPAHTTYPTRRAGIEQAEPVRLGSPAGSNERTIHKYIHADGIRSCQLVLGVTTLEPGSMWNTLPCHTHDRRTEVYFYFDLPADQRIVHLMGQPQETRNLIVANEEAVVSPPWSVHCGFGTNSYSFVWAMGGENQAYNDVEVVAIEEML